MVEARLQERKKQHKQRSPVELPERRVLIGRVLDPRSHADHGARVGTRCRPERPCW